MNLRMKLIRQKMALNERCTVFRELNTIRASPFSVAGIQLSVAGELSKAELSKAELSKAELSKAELSKAELSKAELSF
ncbi:pentapeptide repeat-containing protein [Hymenobacter aerophilus]|uniref:pentapeptide repeat-containing protein n=1 Tax=Hymenobacter aerophilus TaxID=119644 RepID=UPI000A048E99